MAVTLLRDNTVKLVIKFELVAGAAGDEQRQCPRHSSGQQKLLMQLMNCCLLIGKPESEQILLCSFCRTLLLNYELRKFFFFCIVPACKYVFIFISCCWRVPLFVVVAVAGVADVGATGNLWLRKLLSRNANCQSYSKKFRWKRKNENVPAPCSDLLAAFESHVSPKCNSTDVSNIVAAGYSLT